MSVNLLDLIPIKILKNEQSEDGNVTVLKPKFKNKFMAKYVVPKLKSPCYKVKLDEFGSYVWRLIDGKLTVEEIGKKMQENYQDAVEPVYERLSIFIQSMQRYRFIEYVNYENKKQTKI